MCLCMLLVLTTLSHFLILLVPMPCQTPLYPWIVTTGTLASVAWHATEERSLLFALLDHSLAVLWSLSDIMIAAQIEDLGLFIQVFYLNVATFALHQLQEAFVKNRDQYIYSHSLWHLLSAAKGVAVALLLQCPNQGSQEIGDMPHNTLVLYKDRVCQIE